MYTNAWICMRYLRDPTGKTSALCYTLSALGVQEPKLWLKLDGQCMNQMRTTPDDTGPHGPKEFEARLA